MSGFQAHGTGAVGVTTGGRVIGRHHAPGIDGYLTVGNRMTSIGVNAVAAGIGTESIRTILIGSLLSFCCTGCAVVTVADAAVSVVATTVKAGATVVGATVDVAASGVKAVVGSSDENKE